MPELNSPEIKRDKKDHRNAKLERRKQEIKDGGLKENYKGDFMGMQVFEGAVEMRDQRNGEEKLTKFQTRIILSKDMDLPSSVHWQHAGYSKENDTHFATLFFNLIAMFNYGRIVLSSPESKNSREGGRALAALAEQYERNNQGGETYPLTIIHAHGLVNKKGKHFISSGTFEDHPTNLVLDQLLEQYPAPDGIDKIPLLLISCNENEDSKEGSAISHPKMVIAYTKGGVGFFLREETSRINLSK